MGESTRGSRASRAVRRRAVVAALALSAVVAAGAGPALAGLKLPGSIELRPYRLALSYTPVVTPEIDSAIAAAQTSGALGASTPLHAVVDDTTRVGNGVQPWLSGGVLTWKTGCGAKDNGLKALDKKKTLAAWCWPASEQQSGTPVGRADWFPQGVSSTSEASQNGVWDGRHATVVSWYAGANGAAADVGARLTFFRTPAVRTSVPFTHVTLAEPFVDGDGLLDLEPVDSHAGGIAWSGPYLFVPQTTTGIRVFDTRRIYRVDDGPELGASLATGVIQGAGARYVMLEVGRYHQPAGPCATRSFFPLCFSALSVDRTVKPARLVASEYLTLGQMKRLGRGTAIVSWNLAPSGLLATGSNGVSTSLRMRASYTYATQGLVTRASSRQYYFSAGDVGKGWFVWERTGDGRRPLVTQGWPAGAEAVTIDGGPARLWSVTELPGRRMVFWVKACEMRGQKHTCVR